MSNKAMTTDEAVKIMEQLYNNEDLLDIREMRAIRIVLSRLKELEEKEKVKK